VIFGVFPSLVLDLVAGTVANVLRDVTRASAIAIAPEVAVVAIALPIAYVVLRLIYVAYEDTRGGQAIEAGGAAR